MTVNIYKSNDTGAPTLNKTAGSLRALLKACLVDGYGSKSGAGWTTALDDAANHKIIFRNNPTTGTGRYFRIQDDGYLYSGHGGGAYHYGVLRGCESYTDIDTTAGNFPNVAGADTSDNSTYYGVSMVKGGSVSGPYAWMVFADDRTCYMNVAFYDYPYTDPFDAGLTETKYRSMVGFGDFSPFNGTVDAYSAFVIGNGFNSTLYNYVSYFGEGDLVLDKHTSHYLNRGIEGNAGAIEFSKGPLVAMTARNWLGGLISDGAGTFMDYPSPVAGGVVLQPILVQEKTNAAERTQSHSYYEAGRRGTLRGVLSTPHNAKASNAKRLGYPGDTFTVDGRTYLIILAGDSTSNVTLCIDTTGPW